MKDSAGFLIILFILSLPGECLASSTPAGSFHEITVVSDDNYPPYIFKDADGNIQGIIVDQWKLWEEKTGIRVKHVATDWAKALEIMEQGKADVIDTIFLTEKRARIYGFTKPYAKIEVPIFFHKNISGINSISSVQGFTIGVKKGDACIDIFRSHGIIKGLVEYNSYEDIIRDASEEKLRVFCIDYPPALYLLNKYKIEEDFRHSAPLYTGEFHRAVKKGRKDLLKKVEDGFSRITDNEYSSIDKKWFGTALIKPVYLKYVWMIFGIIVSAFIVLLSFSLFLRRQVKAKTWELTRANLLLEEKVRDLVSAKEALRKSETNYKLLADNAHDIIFTMDTNLCFTYISPSIERIRGYTVEEAMSQTPVDALTPASLDVALKVFAEEMEIEKRDAMNLWRTRTLELEEYCKDGSTIWTESTLSPLRDGENKLAGFLGITRDISERKRVDNERVKLEAQLYQAQKIESIGTLAGGIAHDFNNLLMGILGNVSLVLMKMDENNPFRERLKNVEDYIQRGSDLTKQLLGFARGGKYEVKPTDLGEFIRKSSEMFGHTKKEVNIHYKIQNGLWAAEVDRGQMEQVLLNMYVNAWQAMPKGGDLYLTVENVELGEMDMNPYNVNPGRFVKVTITDTGVGMDAKTKARIFEPFFTTKERARGTGLGLASAYGIIKNHGGFIYVDSEPDHGTSFTIYLPASDKPVQDEKTPDEAIQTGHETILIIDDEEMILEINSKMLQGLGYKVITAIGGRQGLQIYENEQDRIDLVILDMIMPDFSGKETFDTLRRVNASVKVLLSSGYSLDEQAEEIMQSGCRGFIQKPFTMLELSKKIRGILDV